MSVLFKNIAALRADGTYLQNIDVAVRHEYIEAIAPQIDGQFDLVINGAGKLLIPGFVNAHTHVPMTLMRGYGDDMPLESWLHSRIFPFESKLTGEDVYWGSLLGIAEMLSTGTTSFSDMYFFCDNIIQAVLESGIKANIGQGFACVDSSKRFRDLPECQTIKSLLAQYRHEGNGRINIDIAPHSEYTTHPDLLADAADFAAGNQLRIQVHVSETKKEHEECMARHGKTPVQVMHETGIFSLPTTAAHCVWVTDDDMAILAECDVTVAHCPQSNLKLGSGIASVEAMRAKGVSVALGTDSAASNNNLDMLEEMRTAVLLAKGVSCDPYALPAEDAIRMATKTGAVSQGRADCGDILPGCRADLVMLELNDPCMIPCHNALSNVIHAAGAAQIRMTMADGRILYKDGEFPTLDMEKIHFHILQCLDSIHAR